METKKLEMNHYKKYIIKIKKEIKQFKYFQIEKNQLALADLLSRTLELGKHLTLQLAQPSIKEEELLLIGSEESPNWMDLIKEDLQTRKIREVVKDQQRFKIRATQYLWIKESPSGNQ